MRRTKPLSEWKRAPKDWADKNRDGHLRRSRSLRENPTGICGFCGGPMADYNGRSKWCSAKCRYHGSQQELGPVGARARIMAANVRGTGKIPALEKLLREAMDKPCIYCGTTITIKNAGLDHKTPLRGLRGTPAQRELDCLDNLQIVCRRCNGLKGELPHEKYIKLLAFLRTDPEIYARVLLRLSQSRTFWAKHKTRRAAPA